MSLDLDVAIVGGGIAGLYCAWSLQTRRSRLPGLGAAPRIGLFELSQRLGGRLFTLTPPGAPSLRAELGGMRLLSHHHLVLGLARQLGLTIKSFLENEDHDLYFLRGVRLTAGEVKAGSDRFPFQVAASERSRTPELLLGRVILAHLPHALQIARTDWRTTKAQHQIDGRLFHDWSLVEMMQRVLSPEALAFLHGALGYLAMESPQINAADLIETFISDSREKLLTIADGMQTLPLAVGQRIRDAGGRIELGARLQRVDQVREDGEERIDLLMSNGGREQRVRARHVILALPRRSIELLDPESFLFDSASFRSDLETVLPIPASKLNLAYREPWWERCGITTGRSLTDLPIRQCLYFGSEAAEPGGHRNALLTASYCDGPAVAYWEELAQRTPGPNFAGEESSPADLQVSAAVVDAVQEQLGQLHGLEVPAPYWAAYTNWTRDPYGGGWHWWRVGQKSWEVMPRMLRPVPGANLYVCGECWSPCQAWVEGALMTAESVLQQHLGLPWPDWLEPSATLGVER